MKKRLDQILVERNLVESKNKAQALIMAGQVYVDGERSDKAGRPTQSEADICVKEAYPYVSRGALKLEKAYEEFNLSFEGKTICDIGSSTGGFTDFALQHGAARAYAIDVGTGQLAQKIREDNRVIVMERTDFRDVRFCHSEPCEESRTHILDPSCAQNDTKGTITDPIDIFVCDVSFISLKMIIPKVISLAHPGVECVLLIKPQFEAGAKDVSRGKGIIRDEALRLQIVEDIKSFAIENGFEVAGIVESPTTGAKGNVEYLLHLNI